MEESRIERSGRSSRTSRVNERERSPGAWLAYGVSMGAIMLLVATMLVVGIWGTGFGAWDTDSLTPLLAAVFLFGCAFTCGMLAPTVLRSLAKGITGLMRVWTVEQDLSPSGTPGATVEGDGPELRLLEAIGRHGEVTPVRAALEAKLPVAEADRRLTELAESGYLEVRVEDGKIVYRL